MELLWMGFAFSFAFKASSLVTNAIRKMSKNYPKNTLFPKLLHFERTIIVTGDQVSDASALSQQPM